MTTCADTSFLVSCYISDAHSVLADRQMAASHSIQITPFNRAEFATAVFQQVFLKRLLLNAAQQVWHNFENDCKSGVLQFVHFPSSAWETAIDLARRHGPTLGNRTLDSLHVACALELGAGRFWTFDERQARLAEAAGLNTGP